MYVLYAVNRFEGVGVLLIDFTCIGISINELFRQFIYKFGVYLIEMLTKVMLFFTAYFYFGLHLQLSNTVAVGPNHCIEVVGKEREQTAVGLAIGLGFVS
jgi:hypothetical protein